MELEQEGAREEQAQLSASVELALEDALEEQAQRSAFEELALERVSGLEPTLERTFEEQAPGGALWKTLSWSRRWGALWRSRHSRALRGAGTGGCSGGA